MLILNCLFGIILKSLISSTYNVKYVVGNLFYLDTGAIYCHLKLKHDGFSQEKEHVNILEDDA